MSGRKDIMGKCSAPCFYGLESWSGVLERSFGVEYLSGGYGHAYQTRKNTDTKVNHRLVWIFVNP